METPQKYSDVLIFGGGQEGYQIVFMFLLSPFWAKLDCCYTHYARKMQRKWPCGEEARFWPLNN